MTFDRISTLAALCLLPACLLPSPAEAQSFQGTFSGEGVMMTLQPSRDRFYGTLIFADEFYSIEADEKEGELTGSFVTAKGEFDFKATFRGNLLELETNSVTYVLRRAGQGAGDEPEPASAAADPAEPVAASAPEPSASAVEPAEPEAAGPAAEPMVVEATEPAADEPPVGGGTLTSMSFEEGALSDGRQGPRPGGTDASSRGFQPVETITESAVDEPVAAAPVDEALIGTWLRGTIAADAGTLLTGVTDLELTAAGTFVTAGASGNGHWKAEERTLFLRSLDAEEWQPYCRYKLVADTLLCTVDEDSRQLWFRR